MWGRLLSEQQIILDSVLKVVLALEHQIKSVQDLQEALLGIMVEETSHSFHEGGDLHVQKFPQRKIKVCRIENLWDLKGNISQLWPGWGMLGKLAIRIARLFPKLG